MPASDPVSAQIASVVAWFEHEPADDPVEDLAQLRRYFVLLGDPALAAEAHQRFVEQFEGRVLDICGRFKPQLLNANLPLGRELHTATTDLIAALLDVARAFQHVIDAMRERWTLAVRADPGPFAGRALCLVNEAFVLGCMSGAMAPSDMWRRAYALMAGAGKPEPAPDGQAEAPTRGAAFNFKRLVALSALQPESLTAREVAWICDYVESIAALGKLGAEPILPETSAFWIDPASDVAPHAMVRRAPGGASGLLHFSAQAMSRRAGEHIEWLETRIAEAGRLGGDLADELLESDGSGLPLGLTPLEALSLLRRVRDRWSTPPSRATVRHPHQYTVQVCAGLRAIWDMARLGPDSAKLAEWMVYNESPGGYAIMSVSGVVGMLSAGMALALRRDAGHPWAICIVRWIRSERPDQAELGLQVIAHACTPVSIGFRGGDVRSMSPALVLPPVPGLRANQAVLAPTGTYSSRRFLLVHDGQRVYVAQARVLSLDMQTASVELFQYEIDSYPI